MIGNLHERRIMSTWSIIATILFLLGAGASGWLYYENSNLKRDLGSSKGQKEEEVNKVNTALDRVDTLGYFAETYLDAKQNPDEMTELAKKITDIDDRNLQVAYGALKEASEKDEQVALQNFLAEFTRVITETLGGEIDTSESSESQAAEEESQQIEGEGEYSENVFP